MDAKPQRIRVRMDENAAGVLPGKTIHQRNKSTPALSAAFQNASTKNGPRRAAFGDVSNTTSLAQGSRDDGSLGGKKQLKLTDKGVVPARRATILSQPAQRPMKGGLNNASKQKPLQPSVKQTGLNQHTANIRKPLNKRAAVFKDNQEPLAETKKTASKETTITKSTEENKEGPISLPATVPEHKDIPREEVLLNETSKINSDETEEYSIVNSDDIDGAERDACKADDDNCKVQFITESQAYESAATTKVNAATNLPKSHRESASSAHVAQDHLPAPSEPEEYWDDEEDENEEDDGYITARSYRSRGDNTTGGATTVLFPKYNQQVRRELALAKQVVEATRSTEDIEDEFWDTSMVAEYSDEIFEYMKEQEIRMLPNAHYMDNQAEIQWSMRSVLMDWLVQVHHRFSLLPETLFLCVNYIDRFLSSKIVSLGKLQLVGATAIFIAAKYEEINCPSVQEIVYMVDGGYTVDEILKAERFMLSMLQFELGWPGPMSFLRKISKADDYDLETRTLAKYFLEVTIMDERFVGSPPSFIAAGAHCLARLLLRKGNWTPAHVHYAEYTYSQLFPLVSLMLECCEIPRKHHCAIYEKYTDKRFKRASLFAEAEIKKGFRLPEITRESISNDRNSHVEPAHHWKRI
ncbi:cyclin family protein [Aspergillus clavatus NRRL 1]|uniref:G2/mitotic-specific cyclin, putative n=1 Tax=Aspergillus clavatus (strain ATCC 1007 / CBS 513.65 / DSM 816 / NCTC 3887 / NRRL 1 / QM 1276 / 107) TaxID=344612 RepID=A1C7V2_ASPCL|nr:G2/mitotic-specific cyclin, putative [Aspergillus clavatus NRRL 1]EAW14473.1 G2/mitotic-specific cyclin, putative [Aspergillus clavatus NRRL 1]